MSSDGEVRHPRHHAVALHYSANQEELPTVVASGAGAIAQQILAVAQMNEIPVRRDPELAGILANIDPGKVITEESFRLVAEVLCFLYMTDKQWREQHPDMGKFFPE